MKWNGKEFGRAVRSRREVMGISARDAGAVIGVSFATLARIEKGETSAQIENVVAVAVWAGLSLESYIDRSEASQDG